NGLGGGKSLNSGLFLHSGSDGASLHSVGGSASGLDGVLSVVLSSLDSASDISHVALGQHSGISLLGNPSLDSVDHTGSPTAPIVGIILSLRVISCVCSQHSQSIILGGSQRASTSQQALSSVLK